MSDFHLLKKIKSIYRNFSHWIAFQPPGALTMEAWNSFNAEFRKKAPIRYFIDKGFGRIFVLPISRRYESIRWWIVYRTVSVYHKVVTDLKPGYYEADERILHANFSILKDFVEIEESRRWYYSSGEHKKNIWRHLPFYEVFVPYRNSEFGIKQLEWGMSLDDPALPAHERHPEFARIAKEMLELYCWWIKDRPSRIAIPYPDVDTDDLNFPTSNINGIYNQIDKQRLDWDLEDDEMLIRLIKIRRRMWT